MPTIGKQSIPAAPPIVPVRSRSLSPRWSSEPRPQRRVSSASLLHFRRSWASSGYRGVHVSLPTAYILTVRASCASAGDTLSRPSAATHHRDPRPTHARHSLLATRAHPLPLPATYVEPGMKPDRLGPWEPATFPIFLANRNAGRAGVASWFLSLRALSSLSACRGTKSSLQQLPSIRRLRFNFPSPFTDGQRFRGGWFAWANK